MSWTFVNDSLCTTLCLQWEPEVIAIALMYLAAKLSKFEVKDWKNRTTEVHQIIEVHLITEDLQTTGVLIIEDLHRTTTGLLQMMVIEVGVVDLLIEGVDLPLEVGLVVLLHTEALLITGPQDPGVVAVGGGPTDIKTGCGVAHCKNFYST